jgi:cytochrome c556
MPENRETILSIAAALLSASAKQCLIVILVAASIATAALAEDYEAHRAELIKDLPAEVVAVIDRLVMCNHWSDESPYDAERARTIEAAVTQLRCGTVDADASNLEHRYGSDSANARALQQARGWFP